MSVPEHCRPLLNDLLALVANGEQSKRRVYPALLRLEAALTKDTTRWDVVGIRCDLPERISTWLVDHFPFDLESVQSRRARPKIKKLATEWHISARHKESEEEGQPEAGRREDREHTRVTNGGSTTTMSSVDGAAVQSLRSICPATQMGPQTPSQTLESPAVRSVSILAEAKTSTNSLIGHRKSPQTINLSDDDDEEDEEVPYDTPELGDSGDSFGTCDSPTLVEMSRSAVNRPVLIPRPAPDEPSPLQAKAALNRLGN